MADLLLALLAVAVVLGVLRWLLRPVDMGHDDLTLPEWVPGERDERRRL